MQGISIKGQKLHEIQMPMVPGLGGFSARNLWRMRDFYQSYSADGKLPPMVAEVG